METGPGWISGFAEPASGRFIAYADEHVIRIYNRSTKQTSIVPVTVGAAFGSSLSISRSGRRLIFPREAEHSANDPNNRPRPSYIWSVDLDTLTGVPVGEPRRVSLVLAQNADISPDGRQIVVAAKDSKTFTTAGTQLVVMPSDGGDERMLDSASRIMRPRFSADGKWIYYTRGNTLMRASVTGKARDSLASLFEGMSVADVSPDGKLIALSSQFIGVVQEIRDTTGKLVARFVANSGDDRIYGWSRSEPSTLLAFRLMEPVTLKSYSLSDGNISSLSLPDRMMEGPKVSPNKRQLAFVGNAGDDQAIIIIDLTSKQRRVVTTALLPARPLWSPNGQRISYLSVDPATGDRLLNVVDVATGRVSRLGDVHRGGEIRWRDDGEAIDVIQGKFATGRDIPEVHRFTMSGKRTVVRPLVKSDNSNDGPTRLLNDSLVVVGMNDRLLLFPLPAGEPRTINTGFWSSPAPNGLSPDGKWIASEVGATDTHSAQLVIASLDGKTIRRLGLTKGCDVMSSEWLPDSRGLVAWAADRCNDWREDPYLVPIDGSQAMPLTLPANESYIVAPGGKALLMTVYEPKSGSIIGYDLSNALGKSTSSKKAGTR